VIIGSGGNPLEVTKAVFDCRHDLDQFKIGLCKQGAIPQSFHHEIEVDQVVRFKDRDIGAKPGERFGIEVPNGYGIVFQGIVFQGIGQRGRSDRVAVGPRQAKP